MLNEQFFATVRSSIYGGHLPQTAVDNFNAVCKVFDAFTGHDHCPDDLAVILATVVIETGKETNLAIEEIGKGRSKAYGQPAGPYGKLYYGRGPCQCTWLANYAKADKRIAHVDFVQFPERMCDPHYGVLFMIDSMYGGTFTGKGLRTYITPGKPTPRDNFMRSRQIINGLDRAEEHAGYCVNFSRALAVGYVSPLNSPQAPATAQPQPPQMPMRRGLVWEVLKLLGKG